MIKMELYGAGYKFSFGTGISVYAQNTGEAVNVFKHYLGVKHNKRKCPSCEEIK